jgi:tRNA threonylcarbamoyladenosine biosynthesis protein TsaB
MLTLALDTTAEFGSIAVAEDSSIRKEVLLHAPEGFSGILFARIDSLLGRLDLRVADIDLFAAASGPGSFTGVRIGLAAIKGLAEVLDRPAIAVSNLEALATFGSAELRAPVIDARRGEVYCALFDGGGHIVAPESVLPFQRFLERVKDTDFEWISSHFDPFRPAIAGTRFETLPITVAPRAAAGAVARLAYQKMRSGAAADPAAIEANYVRRSDAEIFWKF